MSSSRSLTAYLALNRTVVIVLISVLFFGLGEQLWERFMPEYLRAQTKQAAMEAQAAGVTWAALWIIGLYAFLRNVFEGSCYIGGGRLTARLGDRGSLILFGVLTIAGYVLFLTSQTPLAAIVAALLIVGWEPLSVPVTFTTVGSTVEDSKQGMAFAIQSIQKRLPRVIGPAIAGFVLGAAQRHYQANAEYGDIVGMRILIAIALALGVTSLVLQWWFMPHHEAPPPGPPSIDIVRGFHPTLRTLLVAEIFTRWCDWLVRQFVVVYLIAVRGVSAEVAGLYFAAESLTALLTYLPIGRMTQTVGLQPFIGVTFIFFALFPLVLAICPTEFLLVAFIVNGLREIGEPARKAMITSLMPPEVRARGVGLYWGIRSFAMCSSSLVGAALWYAYGPEVLFYVAFALGCVGAAVFYLWVGARAKQPSDDSAGLA